MFTGRYNDDATSFTVANLSGSGAMTVNGVTVPVPVVDGFSAGLTNPVPYTIVGDMLTFSVTAPEGNVFTITLTGLPDTRFCLPEMTGCVIRSRQNRSFRCCGGGARGCAGWGDPV